MPAVLLAVFPRAATGGADAPEGGRLHQRDQVARDPSLLRYYTFETPGDRVPNLAPCGVGALTVRENEPYAARPADLARWTVGRWPGTSALEIGTNGGGVLRSGFYRTLSGKLTLAVWIRTHLDPGRRENATICSLGDAYTGGWALTTGWTFGGGFRLGRPPGTGPGQGVVSVTAGPALTGHVWHFLVAELDGQWIRLYIDGLLAGQKEFDGLYEQPAAPTGYLAQAPEVDRGGLGFGTTPSAPGKLRFDLAELAIFDRTLTAEEQRAHFEAGRPSAGAGEQAQTHRDWLARQAALDAIRLDIPKDLYGYFPRGTNVPVIVVIPASTNWTGLYRVSWQLDDDDGHTVWTQDKSISLAPDKSFNAIWLATLPDRCGLYALSIALRDAAGALVKEVRYPIATRVPVPPVGQLGAKFPLALYGGLELHPEDLALGARNERLIPWCPRLPDGSPGFQYSDRDVKAALDAGLDVMFCISPRFDLGQVDLTKVLTDPREWENWVRCLVEHYKGRVRYWEIINEPNANKVKPDQYVAMLKSAHRVIRDVDPAARIVGLGGTSSFPEWTEDVLAAGGGPYFDILALHDYIDTSPIRAWRNDRKIERVKASMARHLPQPVPLWNTECGLWQPERVGGRPMTDAEMRRRYAGRASTRDGWTTAHVDAIMMTTEHRGACWQVEHILTSLARGVDAYFLLMGSSRFYPEPNSSCGYPSEKGLAWAALAASLKDFDRATFLPLRSSSAAGVLIAARDGKRTAVLFADQPTPLLFKVPGRQAMQGMDVLGNPREWHALAGGLLPVTLGLEPLYLFDVPDSFAEAEMLAFKNVPVQVAVGASATGAVCVTNLRTVPLDGRIEMAASNCQVTVPAAAIHLAPRQSVSVPFTLRAGELARGQHAIQVRLREGDAVLDSAEALFASEGVARAVPRLAVPIQLDALATALDDLPAETADQATQVTDGRPDVGFVNTACWQGPQDLSFTVRTAWHPDDGMYILVDVIDDDLRPPPADKAREGYVWDCIELFFDGRPLNAQTVAYGPGAEQLLVIPATNAAPTRCAVINLVRQNPTLDADFFGRKTATGYRVVGRIRPLAGGTFKLVPGTALGLDIAVDDAAPQAGQRKAQMALHGTAANCKDTSAWGRYRLTDITTDQ